jgi:hypothetical protein
MGEFHEAIVAGGWPAGLTAGIYLRREGIDALLLEKGVIGGTHLQTERIENYPGFSEGILGREAMGRMAEQGRRTASLLSFSAAPPAVCLIASLLLLLSAVLPSLQQKRKQEWQWGIKGLSWAFLIVST